MNSNTSELLLAIDEQRQNLAANLSQKGVAASGNEGLETLVPKVLNITGGGSGNNINPYLSYDQLIPSDNYIKKVYSGSSVSDFDLSEFNINWDKVKYILVGMYNKGQTSNWGMSIALPFVLEDNMYFVTDKTLEEMQNHYASSGWDKIFPVFWTTHNNTFYPRNGSDPDNRYYRVKFNAFITKPSTGVLLHRSISQTLTGGLSFVYDSLYPTFIAIGWDD